MLIHKPHIKNDSEKSIIQPQLHVGQPNDEFEREADSVADSVMRQSDENNLDRQPVEEEEELVQPALQMQPIEEEEQLQTSVQMQPIKEEEGEEVIQSKSQSEPDLLQMKCTDCAEEDELSKMVLEKAVGNSEEPLVTHGRAILGKKPQQKLIQTKSTGKKPHISADFEHRLQTEKNNNGEGLPKSIKNQMSAGFARNLDNVRIHNNRKAAELNNAINAKAFTNGNHIFFNSGQYNPYSFQGKHLIAHELTHTIQQGAVKRGNTIQRTIGDGHDFPAASRFSGNVALEATFDNQRLIRNGHRGTHVRLIQEALIRLGYELPRFGADSDFGVETENAVRAFQQDVGLSVDGIVGPNTVDFLDKRDRGVEVNPPTRPVTANAPFDVSNAIVRPGATPSIALGTCEAGLTFPENVQVGLDMIRNGANWQPILTQVVGNYSLQHRLLPGMTEVTGPGGNTTAANYCAQITELNALGVCPGGRWYMDSAILEHERVHATRFRPALIHNTVINPLETAIEGIRIPAVIASNAGFAELMVRITPAFIAALTTARTNWLARILILVANDHNAGGPTDTAEHGIVDPMVRRICRHAQRNGWPGCAPLCP